VAASPDRPVLIDKFLEDAIEVDVDAISDGQRTIVGGVMEHIEEAGVHSGDSACVIPPYSLSPAIVDEIRNATYAMAAALQVRGLMNVQYAVKQVGDESVVYVLEVNPRASRTSPFVSKATNISLPKAAAKVMVGVSLEAQGITKEVVPPYTSVKESVFPFTRFAGVDIILGPEMKSTGEVMGIASDFPIAYAKAQIAAGNKLPESGTVFVSLAGRHKFMMIDSAKKLAAMGYKILSTSGTARVLKEAGIPVEIVRKVQEGRPNLLDYMANRDVQMVLNTPSGKGARTDEGRIRSAAVLNGVVCVTTLPGCIAMVQALEAVRDNPNLTVTSLQEWAKLMPSPA
jgi:carbamoyl-phosphate synthase large subunit